MPDQSPRPTLLLQVDLDSLWAIRRVYGLSGGPSATQPDPVFCTGLERLLDLLAARRVPATFFTIGKDSLPDAHRVLLRRALAEGHEIANHSETHPLGLGRLTPPEIRSEIERANDAIELVTGRRPVGFRAPGFDCSPTVLQAVAESGLLYDSSLLPTLAAPVLRVAARFLGKKGTVRSGKEENATIPSPHPEGDGGGSGHYGNGPVHRAPRTPYFADLQAPWRSLGSLEETVESLLPPPAGSLLEVPVSVTPFLRLPIHASVSLALGGLWTRFALASVLAGTPVVVYLIHAIDLADGNALEGLPGGFLGRRLFRQSLAYKQAYLERALDRLLARCKPERTDNFIHRTLRRT
ncbi:MAG TPA: polysaccharide deacetylase family protein [Candidatus Sumerlaeota bacterium]|nr:polysaccharide deacetylase family protein [Candidatus Sumerlaeota bacterium]